MRCSFKPKDESGQTTIEFALAIMLVVVLTVFFFQLAMVLAFGNYAQYSTFMAARAYFAAGPDEGDQRRRAMNVISQSIKRPNGRQDRWPSLAQGVGGDQGVSVGEGPGFSMGSGETSWMRGVTYQFQTKFFFLPGDVGGDLRLTSESWLGREPTYQECREYLEQRVGAVFIDNGC